MKDWIVLFLIIARTLVVIVVKLLTLGRVNL